MSKDKRRAVARGQIDKSTMKKREKQAAWSVAKHILKLYKKQKYLEVNKRLRKGVPNNTMSMVYKNLKGPNAEQRFIYLVREYPKLLRQNTNK